jgi:integrase
MHRQGPFWVAFRIQGKLIRESTGTHIKAEAERFLRARLSAVGSGRVGPEAHRSTIATLEKILSDDYKANGREATIPGRRFKRLRDFFGIDAAARGITTDRLTAYQQQRLSEGAKPATVNRELAALRRAFRLAARAGRVESAPFFPMLQERNVRTGFMERDHFEAVRSRLPRWLAPAVTFMFNTGWRVGEVLRLQWKNVDIKAGVIRLDVGSTKNRQGRVLPFDALPEVRDLMKSQRANTTAIERELGAIVPFVFHNRGRELFELTKGRVARGARPEVYKEWKAACVAAGRPGALLHDFRRTAVRNMERATVSRSVAMKISGHVTESVYRRYAIVSEADISEGLAKVAALAERAKA